MELVNRPSKLGILSRETGLTIGDAFSEDIFFSALEWMMVYRRSFSGFMSFGVGQFKLNERGLLDSHSDPILRTADFGLQPRSATQTCSSSSCAPTGYEVDEEHHFVASGKRTGTTRGQWGRWGWRYFLFRGGV